jgi:hypothetical protein
MTTSQANSKQKTPWHLWLVGIIALLWGAMGAMDYVMTQTKNESYMSAFTPEQLEFFYGFPTWVVATWAIAVWGGVFGAIFLLIRKAIAVYLFLLSLIAMVVTAIHNYGLANGMEVIGDAFSLGFTAAIFVLALAFFLYAKTMKTKGVIR